MATHANTFRLVIASVGETRFDGAAASVTLPSAAGELTVLANHEPLVTTLKKGTIVVKDAEGTQKRFDIENGVLECAHGRTVVLL